MIPDDKPDAIIIRRPRKVFYKRLYNSLPYEDHSPTAHMCV